MAIIQAENGKECECETQSVLSFGSTTTFSNEQPIYSVPTVVTKPTSTPTKSPIDNDRKSIISSSTVSSVGDGGKTHSIFPGIKNFIQYNNFENEKDCSCDDGGDVTKTAVFVQKWLDAIAGIDLILLVISIVLAFTTEKYLCYDGPVRLDYSKEMFLSNSTSEEMDSSSMYSLTAYNYVKDQVLKKMMVDSPLIYHIIVILLLALSMGYFVTEIWLFCLLIRIGREKRPSNFCIKWMAWRSIILMIILIIALTDVINAHQVTCAEVIVVPFQVVRMFIGGVPVVWVLCNMSQNWSSRGYV